VPVSLSGIAAYLLLWAASLTGVAASYNPVRRRVRWLGAPAHETLSLAGLGAALLHASQSVLAPQGVQLGVLVFASPGSAAGWGLSAGVLALYLTAASAAAFYGRRYLGEPWRIFHALAYAGYGAALWHALWIGANTWLPAVRWGYAATGLALAAATVVRLSGDALVRRRAPS
jgi:DMSO/TMAO reductase YedYZ heme-binding membrane subunit